MTTFYSRFVRYALTVMATLILAGSLFWDGWSFSGPFFRYSAWLQPSVFIFSLVALAYALMSHPQRQKTLVTNPIRVK
jgi:thiamine transporter ThiT